MNDNLKKKILNDLIKSLSTEDLFDLIDFVNFELMKRGF